MTTSRFHDDAPDLDALYAELSANDLQPLWRMHGALTPEPKVATRPFIWKSEVLRRLAARSGELVGIDRGGDRRVLACSNPGLDGQPYVSSTMWAAVQYLGAGEVAPAHRHTPAALRFVLSGDGVWTLVNSDPLHMSRGDLILTPSMTFHEHHNAGAEPMTWMDVLDLPVVAGLDAVFFEEGPTETVDQRTDPTSESERRYGGGPGLLPISNGKVATDRPHSPLLAYRWADTERALEAQLSTGGAVTAGIRFSDPTTGRDVMPTMRCELHRLRPGAHTERRQQTGSRVAAVLNGTGTAAVGTERFALAPGDIFVVPSWAPYSLEADEQLDVFSTSDAPVLEALGLYREKSL